MAAGEREWDERPVLPSREVAASQGLGCGLRALIILAFPVGFAILAGGAFALWSVFG